MATSKSPPDSWLERNECLLRFVGARLTSVQFVLNYLILGFDERGALTTLVWPEISQGPVNCKFGEQEYRNRLCELIEKIVTSAGIDERDQITIQLSDGSTLMIPLGTYSGSGERAILNGPKWFRVF
jgi:hypothetical protein